MQDKMLKMLIGVEHDGKKFKEVPLADTGAEAEEVFMTKPTSDKIYTWLGEVLSVAILKIGDTYVSSAFLKNRDRKIPAAVKAIPLNDVGTLVLQIQRECWQDVIPNQNIQCAMCPTSFVADIDLNRIEVAEEEGAPEKYEYIDIPLSKTYTIRAEVEQLKEWEGVEYNCIRFRIPLLADAIRWEKLNVDEVEFFRQLANDCQVALVMRTTIPAEDEDGEAKELVEEVGEGYLALRGKMLYRKDLNSKDLRTVRNGLVGKLPSAKMYYEDTCACGKRQVPYFTQASSFFSS